MDNFLFLMVFGLKTEIFHKNSIMALIKQKLIRGIPCDYWRLVNMEVDLMRKTTSFTLAVYYSKEARLQNEENIQEYLNMVVNEVDFTTKTAYEKIKESKIGVDFIDGKMIDVQKNWFFDSSSTFEPGQSGFISPVITPLPVKKTVIKEKPISLEQPILKKLLAEKAKSKKVVKKKIG